MKEWLSQRLIGTGWDNLRDKQVLTCAKTHLLVINTRAVGRGPDKPLALGTSL